MTIDFALRDVPGRVEVEYLTNDDPARWGYPLLGLDSLVEVSRGFPVVHAEVEHPAEGYAAIMAWVQVVRMTDLETGEYTALVDLAPQLIGLDLPYMSFGIRPHLFDAPSTMAAEMDWAAEAFLVVSPDCLMTRALQVLCGFSWGYRLRGGQPEPTPLATLEPPSWEPSLAFLAEKYPTWTFEAAD